MAAKTSPTAIALYVVAGLVAAYFLLRPRAAYAQPGAPAPGLPGPGVPPGLPGPGVPPTPEAPPPAVAEFPLDSSIRLPEGVVMLTSEGPLNVFIKKRSVASVPAWTVDKLVWRGYAADDGHEVAGWFSTRDIVSFEPAAVVAPLGASVLWTPEDGWLGNFQ